MFFQLSPLAGPQTPLIILCPFLCTRGSPGSCAKPSLSAQHTLPGLTHPPTELQFPSRQVHVSTLGPTSFPTCAPFCAPTLVKGTTPLPPTGPSQEYGQQASLCIPSLTDACQPRLPATLPNGPLCPPHEPLPSIGLLDSSTSVHSSC